MVLVKQLFWKFYLDKKKQLRVKYKFKMVKSRVLSQNQFAYEEYTILIVLLGTKNYTMQIKEKKSYVSPEFTDE